MEWYNKAIFQYDIYNTTIRAQEPVLSKIKHQVIFKVAECDRKIIVASVAAMLNLLKRL